MGRDAAIIAAYEHPAPRTAPDYTPLRFIGESARGALEQCGLKPSDVDGIATTGETMAPVSIAEYLDIHPRWLDSTGIGGSSFLSHIFHARDAIRQGHARVVLIVYGSTARSSAAAFGSQVREVAPDPMAVADAESYIHPYGVVLASQYALVASRHMHKYGTTRAQLAEIAVACRTHAGLNPNALYRDPITIDDVLSAPPIATPLHRLDCCVITDGGGAVIVADTDVLADVRGPGVAILGGGEAVGHTEMGQRDLVDTAANQSGPRAFDEAGIRHDDVDLIMVYDSFTITVMTVLEGLGFCKPGEGGSFVENGRLLIGGDLPLNPDGGALSNTHPGRRGLFLAIEATRQLRGEGGPRQVDGAKTAVCHGVGGYLGHRHSGVTLVLGGMA